MGSLLEPWREVFQTFGQLIVFLLFKEFGYSVKVFKAFFQAERLYLINLFN